MSGPDAGQIVATAQVQRVRKRQLVGARDTGPARGLWHIFHTLRERLEMQRVLADAWMGVFMDDPQKVDEGRRKNLACAVVGGEANTKIDGLTAVTLPAGEVLAVEFDGVPLDSMESPLRRALLLKTLELGREPAARAGATASPEAGIREMYLGFPSAAARLVRIRMEVPLAPAAAPALPPLPSPQWEFVSAPAMPTPGAPLPALVVDPALGPVLGAQHAVTYLNAAIKVAQDAIDRTRAQVDALLRASK